jgi:hypothetical protein
VRPWQLAATLAAGGTLLLPAIPGALNPRVTQRTIEATVCVAGWTRTVRPPVSYTNALKRRQIAALGYRDPDPADYEEDHLVPLELGGNPTSPRNLWPEPRAQAAASDPVENRLHRRLCAGELTLRAARAQIVRFKRAHG